MDTQYKLKREVLLRSIENLSFERDGTNIRYGRGMCSAIRLAAIEVDISKSQLKQLLNEFKKFYDFQTNGAYYWFDNFNAENQRNRAICLDLFTEVNYPRKG